MYQDQDAGSYGPVIIYNPGRMEAVMRGNREFVLIYSDNQESNSFLALHNVQKYLPGMASQVANLSYEYPTVTQGVGNYSIWYPQFINTPKTNVTTTMASNFFPVSLPAPPLSIETTTNQPPDQRLHLRQQPPLQHVRQRPRNLVPLRHGLRHACLPHARREHHRRRDRGHIRHGRAQPGPDDVCAHDGIESGVVAAYLPFYYAFEQGHGGELYRLWRAVWGVSFETFGKGLIVSAGSYVRSCSLR